MKKGDKKGGGDSRFNHDEHVQVLRSTNGTWSVTPQVGHHLRDSSKQVGDEASPKLGHICKRSRLDKGLECLNDRVMQTVLDNEDCTNNCLSSNAVAMDGESMTLQPEDNDEFGDTSQTKAARLELEIAQMEKQIQERKLRSLQRKKAFLQQQLEEDDEDDEVVLKIKDKKKGKRSHAQGKSINHDNNLVDEWEGLMSASKVLGEGDQEQTGQLPLFVMVKSIFIDEQEPEVKKKRTSVRVDAGQETGSEREGTEEDSEGEEEEEEGNSRRRRTGKLKSGIFAKASQTKIVKQVLYPHAMLECEQVDNKEIAFNDLTFPLLVAGELKVVLSKVSSQEKWTRLNLLKKLAYKSQYLDQKAVLEQYAGFVNKIEKGKFKRGLEVALRELDESL